MAKLTENSELPEVKQIFRVNPDRKFIYQHRRDRDFSPRQKMNSSEISRTKEKNDKDVQYWLNVLYNE